MSDPVASPIRRLLEVYRSDFAGLKFPELDLEVLSAGVEVAEDAARQVAEAELALESARGRLTEAQGELGQKAHRALSLLKIYAEDDDERLTNLEAIVLSRPARKGLRRRGEESPEVGKRRGKREVESPLLFPDMPQELPSAPVAALVVTTTEAAELEQELELTTAQ